MRVAFIQKDPLTDPAMMVLGASVVFRGHQATVFIPAAERHLERAIRRFAPDAVVFAPPTGFHHWAIEQARHLREITGGTPMLFTGTHATHHPEMAREDGVDLIMTGDPETTLPEILLKISRAGGKARDLPGTTGTVTAKDDGSLIVGGERQVIDDLDDLPLADTEIYRRYRFVRAQTTLSFAVGRGVTENTHAGFRIGPKELAARFCPARRHSVGEAIRRLHLHTNRRTGYRRVAFRDDSLLMDKGEGWLEAFLARYRAEIGLPFSCLARPDQLSDERIRMLAEAGCDRVRLGIESGDSELRRSVTGVDYSNDSIRAVAGSLKDQGMAVHTINFLGIPGETLETATRTLDLNIDIQPAHAFAILLNNEEGASLSPELERMQLLMPLVVQFPALRGSALKALRVSRPGLYQRLFQTHHDWSFLTSGELAPRDILGIAARMRRTRNSAA
ncbi:MAG: B12-binding domain-containing radical SAM protein [Myxococcota bacterium]|nr:B12-binding domain-containing radical SAM protein [Myxococcota bacterium]